ncbi:MAG TPA: hypothetical protein PK443_03405 [bacterium]|nr:hypothetical protein [bacterium]
MLFDGVIVSVVSVLVVFIGISMILALIVLMGNISIKRTQKKLSKQLKPVTKQEVKMPTEVSSAIAMALYLNKFLSDEEHHLITIQKSTMPFSPWLTRGRNSVVAQNNSFYGRKK